jgi:predicted acylesterase/phospholipase RssA
MKTRLRTALAAAIILILTGCATYPVNPPLAQYNPQSGYRFENLTALENSDSLFVILTFSGGGTRAAALSYGVLEKLRDTKIQWEGKESRLLDEVDVISGISGGSFTAAYFGLFGDELFDPEKYQKVFLYRNIQSDLITSMFNPINWFRLASPYFGRIDLAQEIYDQEIFRQKSFNDLTIQGRRPFIMINATDMTFGSQFTFTQDQFDLLCSDLNGVHVARAVAASSNFPIAFTPMIVNNYAGTCGYKEPTWMDEASKDLLDNPPRFNRARIARSYLNKDERTYIHLLDGGIADNIGLRSVLVALGSNDLPWNLPNKMNQGKIKKIVVIVVDARTEPKTTMDKTARSPRLTKIIDTIATVPMSNYSFETVQELFKTFDEWRKDSQNYDDCKDVLDKKCPGANMPAKPPAPVDTYGIYVGFDQIKDQKKREYFLNMPTTFSLKKEEVDDLRKIGPEILDDSGEFQRLLKGL